MTPAKGITAEGAEASLEGLTTIDADMILLSKSPLGADLMNTATWKNLKAVKNKQVYEVDIDFRIKMYYPIGVSENLDELKRLFIE